MNKCINILILCNMSLQSSDHYFSNMADWHFHQCLDVAALSTVRCKSPSASLCPNLSVATDLRLMVERFFVDETVGERTLCQSYSLCMKFTKFYIEKNKHKIFINMSYIKINHSFKIRLS